MLIEVEFTTVFGKAFHSCTIEFVKKFLPMSVTLMPVLYFNFSSFPRVTEFSSNLKK